MKSQPCHHLEAGCAAYVVGYDRLDKCAVVNPHAADVDRYLAFAGSNGMAITHVFDAHVHGDAVSGGPALAACADSRFCLHDFANVARICEGVPPKPPEMERVAETNRGRP
jgi:glyoxylase-like metal-dependent hydrolase (beta-lactamase superfamily II)